MPHHLSGGMQQRVAVARALAPRPDVVLLDEPFSSLDAALRTQLRGDVREILRAAGTASVFVTHDQDEALTLGDRMAVMVRGHVEQVGPPEVVYGEPATPFVATFVGTANLVHGTYRDGPGDHPPRGRRLIGRAWRRGQRRRSRRRAAGARRRGEAPDGPADAGAWRVQRRRFTGTEILYEVIAPDGERLWVEAGPAVRRLRVGDAVDAAPARCRDGAFGSGHAAGTARDREPGLESPPAAASGRAARPGLADPLDRLEVERVSGTRG